MTCGGDEGLRQESRIFYGDDGYFIVSLVKGLNTYPLNGEIKQFQISISRVPKQNASVPVAQFNGYPRGITRLYQDRCSTHSHSHGFLGDESFFLSLPEIPNLPGFPWCQLSPLWRSFKKGDPDSESFRKGMLANMNSWGIVYNSFEDLEGDYIDHMKKQIGHDRVWAVGPLLPYEHGQVVTIRRGGSSAVPPEEVLMWLDKKPDDSVV
ncbi:hypothetical protein L2E82_01392 [Cichorium intybus]|uniref:Uncharacterized protein n=1 Tax=Cichorium intybus TaxID=13427 RepID=A0ACB9GZV2_CICIN|nr:hypothetical protein L2E82_01392 [Cichorium intybus]